MKKLLLILFCLPITGIGQEKSFELGALCGGSFNSLNGLESRDVGNSNFSYKTHLQPLGGVLAQYNFNNNFSLKSKLLYHIKGERGRIDHYLPPPSTCDPALPNPNLDVRSDFHYITLPLLAQFNFGQNRWVFFCNTGFYLGSLIKVKTIPQPTGHSPYTEHNQEDFKKLDFGLILGCGVSFQITERIRVFIEPSLDYGLINTSKVELSGDDAVLTQAITSSAGIAYSLWSNKKKTFNGMSTLDCPDYDDSPPDSKQKKKTKWRLILYKDGEKVGGKSKKSKKGKSRLFKKKD